MEIALTTQVSSRNADNLQELAGAFGDPGTLIPFVVGRHREPHEPAGILVGFGVFKLWAGFYFKTPVPIQPMKAIGAAAITQGGAITHGAIFASGLFTGVVWGFMGLSGAVSWIEKTTRTARAQVAPRWSRIARYMRAAHIQGRAPHRSPAVPVSDGEGHPTRECETERSDPMISA